MIKLEDLKTGNKVYGIDRDGIDVIMESVVERELSIIDTPKPTEVVICKGGFEFITRSDEKYIFRTEEESREGLDKLRSKLADELMKSGRFIDRLFECATSIKRLYKSEIPVYKKALELYKENLIRN